MKSLEEVFDAGRFEEILEVYDNELFYDWLMKYEFIGLHVYENQYLVIPVEDIFTSYRIH